MKRFKVDSKIEDALQRVEKCMEENGVTIEYGCDGLLIGYNGKTYRLFDVDSADYPGVQELPRMLEGERIEFDPIGMREN